MKWNSVVILIVMLLMATSLFAAPVWEARTFSEISRPWIEAYGQPDWKAKTTYRTEGKVYQETRAYAWYEYNLYVEFVKDRRYWKGWRLIRFQELNPQAESRWLKNRSYLPKDSTRLVVS